MEVNPFQPLFAFRREEEVLPPAERLFLFLSPQHWIWATTDAHQQVLTLFHYSIPKVQGIERAAALWQWHQAALPSPPLVVECVMAWEGSFPLPKALLVEQDLPELYGHMVGDPKGIHFARFEVNNQVEMAQAFPDLVWQACKVYQAEAKLQHLSLSFGKSIWESSRSSLQLGAYFFPGGMDVWLFQDQQLLLANRFACENVADFAYHLLNAAQQMGWSSRGDGLFVTGYEERYDAIVALLRTYVKNIKADEMTTDAVAQRMRLFSL